MRSWQEQKAAFDALGVVRVGLSSDTVEQAAAMHDKHGFAIHLLSDADLQVTRRYNLQYTDGKTAIPTTILVAPDGTVLWVDVSPNYRKRTPGEAVVAAVRATLATYEAEGRAAAAAPADTVDVVLHAPGPRTIDVIKEVRAVTGLGLADAKALVDGAPRPLREGVPRAEAEALRDRFAALGATVELH